MRDQAGVFTDREEPLAAFGRLMAPTSTTARTLVYWGVSGQGKSTLLRHINDGPHAPRRCELIDLDPLLAIDSPAADLGRDLATVLVDSMARVIADWSARPYLARRRYNRFRARLRAASAPAPAYVDAQMKAAESSSISGASIHIDARQDRTSVHRDVLVDELCRLARGLRRRPCVLLLDTSERLRLLAETTAESPDSAAAAIAVHGSRLGGVAQWFAAELLPRLLAEARGLRVVLAGREPVDHLPAGIVAERVELTEWGPEHTSAYLASCGLDPRKLSRPVHAVCRGVPVWTALVAELARQDGGAEREGPDEALTPQWLSEAAAGRAAHEWLPNQFLRRLPKEQRRVVMAAATLRSVSKEPVRVLLEGTQLSADWYETLCGYSFMRVVQDPQGRSERRLHDLVRLAILTYLEHEEPTHREALHKRAARYFADREAFLEEAYHRFAVGDDGCVDGWWQRHRELRRADDMDGSLRLAEIVTSPEQAPHAFRHFPALAAVAALNAGRIAFDQDRHDDAESLARQAVDAFRETGNDRGRAKALELRASIAHVEGTGEAEELYEQALSLFRSLGRKRATGALLLDLGQLRARSDREAALPLLDEARALLEEFGDKVEAAQALHILAQVYAGLEGGLERAEELYRRVLAEWRALESRLNEAHAMRGLAIVLTDDRASQDEAEQLYLGAIELFRQEDAFGPGCDTVNRLCTLLRETDRGEEAERRYRAVLAEFTDSADQWLKAPILFNLATLLRLTDRPREAKPLMQQAIQLYRQRGQPASEADGLLELAEIARLEKGREEEERFLAQAAEIARGEENLRLRSRVLHARAHFHARVGRGNEADACFGAEIELGRRLGEPETTAGALNCRGHLALDETRFADARTYFTEALDIRRALGDEERQATLHVLLGEVAVRMPAGETTRETPAERAAGHYEQALSLLGRGSGDTQDEVHALRDLAVLTLRRAQEQSHEQEAVRLFERCVALAIEVGDGPCGLVAWTHITALGAWGEERQTEAEELLARLLDLKRAEGSRLRLRAERAILRMMLRSTVSGGFLSARLSGSSFILLGAGWKGGLRTRTRAVLASARSRPSRS
ncbi:tetratricopeptide repeat protein [Streptomyces sp. NPDC056527]|uniref:tetratricopeptide repeat protein n=1 Tax=Streptomyces sp. NPDC056527 TaxID=3345853 RepID=UPI003697C924